MRMQRSSSIFNSFMISWRILDELTHIFFDLFFSFFFCFFCAFCVCVAAAPLPPVTRSSRGRHEGRYTSGKFLTIIPSTKAAKFWKI